MGGIDLTAEKRSRRAFGLGVVGQAYQRLVTIGTQLVVLPIMLSTWGAQVYGGWLAIDSLRNVFSLSDLGMAQIAANELTMKTARCEIDEAREINSSAFFMLLSVALLILAVAGAIALFVPIDQFLNLPVDQARGALAFFLLGGVVAGTTMFGSVSAGLRAEGLFWLMSVVNATNQLLFAIEMSLWSLNGGTYVQVAGTMLVSELLLFGVTWIWFLARTPWARPSARYFRMWRLREMLRPSLSYMLFVLSDFATIQGVNILVSVILGTAAVTAVSAVRTLARMGRMLSSIVIYPLQPLFAQMHSAGDKEAAHRIFDRLKIGSMLISAVYLGALLALGPQFIAWWSRGLLGDVFWLNATMSIAISMEILWFALQTPYVSTNRHSVFAYCVAFSAVGSTALCALLLPFAGIVSAGISLMAMHFLILGFTILRMRTHAAV